MLAPTERVLLGPSLAVPAENMRFRAEAITFQISAGDVGDEVLSESGGGKGKLGVVSYPGMSKTLTNKVKDADGTERLSTFTLHVAPGNFRGGEMIGLLGENGSGKTTFMELLAGSFDEAKKKHNAEMLIHLQQSPAHDDDERDEEESGPPVEALVVGTICAALPVEEGPRYV